MEKERKEEPRTDVIITPSNYLKSLVRIAHCLKEKDKVLVGMTQKNEFVFNDLIKSLEKMDIYIEEVSRINYKVKGYDAIGIIITKRKK